MRPFLLLIAASLAVPAFPQDDLVVLGIATHEGPKYNTEYLRYHRMVPVYREAGVQASLVEMDGLYRQDWTEDQLVALYRRYHTIFLTTTDEGVQRLTPEYEARAKVAGAALARYVREGGGLLLSPRAVRYPGDDDERYWNLVLAPLGCEILHEGNFDKSRAYEGKTLGKAMFWYTTAVSEHPVTAGVRCLYLPLTDFGPTPGQPAMRYSDDWQVIVTGEAEAKSYRSGVAGDPNHINLDVEGTYTTAPPVVAVRTLGEGRIVCFPLSPLFTGLNHGNPLWTDTVETRGDPVAGRPSDTLKLHMNAIHWLAEPARGKADFGTYRPEPYEPVTFPPRVEWDDQRFAGVSGLTVAADGSATFEGPAHEVRAIVGAHTAYTDGSGTVADYVAAAKAAGLSAIVFTDPLEQLTAEELAQLKADCAAAGSDDFYACPGVEFDDALGIRWAFWGEKIVYPEPTFQSPYNPARTYPLWDGRRILLYGAYAVLCSFPPSAVLDYRQLRANGAHPENLWWFFHYLPRVYDHGRLAADNAAEMLFGLRDLRWMAVASFDRITSPDEVARSAATCFTGFRSLAAAKDALNTRCAAYWTAYSAGQYASEGPRVLDWSAINPQMESNWRYTRGAHRVRVRLAVQSDAGLREVIVHDADNPPLRRFLPGGATAFAREFELVHDQQHPLILEVIDAAGRRAWSHEILVYCYKQGLFRCGDNLNILGATGMIWHPDRNQLFPNAKPFHNGENYTLEGWDRGAPLCPMPGGWQENFVYIKGVGPYPHPETHNVMTGALMDVKLSSYNLQIASMRMNHLAERFDTPQRPSPAFCSLPRDLGENEYFERVETLYAPEDRQDYYIIWNHRRRREGEQRYQGGFLWHEGEIRFKKDVTLTGDVPISLLFLDVPTDLERGWGHSVVLTDADGTTKVAMLRDAAQVVRGKGRLRPGGYAAQMPSLVGHLGFYAPPDSDFCYSFRLPGRLYIGLGRDGQEIQAGTVIPYRYGVATFATEEAGNGELERTLRAFNLAGGAAGYPVEMRAGTLEDATFFFTAVAADGEAAFTLGPASQIIDLPLRIRGLADNGCAAVYTHRRPWLRPVPVVDGTAWFQENLDEATEIWVGNVLRCDRAELKLTVVVDGQREGEPPWVEVHNPTDEAITTELSAPPHAPVFTGLRATITVPAGDSARFTYADGRLTPR